MYLHSYRIFSQLHCPWWTIWDPFTQPQPYYSIDRCVHHPFLLLPSRFVSSYSQSLIYWQHAPILSWSTNQFDVASSTTWSISESQGRTGQDKVCNHTSPPDKSNWLSQFNSVQTHRFKLNSILFQVPSTEDICQPSCISKTCNVYRPLATTVLGTSGNMSDICIAQVRVSDMNHDHETIIFVTVNSVAEALCATNEWQVNTIAVQGKTTKWECLFGRSWCRLL